MRPWAPRVAQQPPARPEQACPRLSGLLSRLLCDHGGHPGLHEQASAASRRVLHQACMLRWERAQGASASRPLLRAHPQGAPSGQTATAAAGAPHGAPSDRVATFDSRRTLGRPGPSRVATFDSGRTRGRAAARRGARGRAAGRACAALQRHNLLQLPRDARLPARHAALVRLQRGLRRRRRIRAAARAAGGRDLRAQRGAAGAGLARARGARAPRLPPFAARSAGASHSFGVQALTQPCSLRRMQTIYRAARTRGCVGHATWHKMVSV